MLRKFLLILATGVGLVVGGFLFFLTLVPNSPSEDLRQTDAIVVLTGGSERLVAGLSLLINGYGGEMFVSGVGKGVTVEELFSDEKLSPEQIMLLKQRISLGYSATDTFENGIEVANWVNKKGYKSIRLVTSNYHIPRSLKELSRRLPEVEIIPFPVFPDRVKTRDWWKYPGTRFLLLSEYSKYVYVLLKIRH